eukprot:2992169-Rhodomonas_salina.1
MQRERTSAESMRTGGIVSRTEEEWERRWPKWDSADEYKPENPAERRGKQDSWGQHPSRHSEATLEGRRGAEQRVPSHDLHHQPQHQQSAADVHHRDGHRQDTPKLDARNASESEDRSEPLVGELSWSPGADRGSMLRLRGRTASESPGSKRAG